MKTLDRFYKLYPFLDVDANDGFLLAKAGKKPKLVDFDGALQSIERDYTTHRQNIFEERFFKTLAVKEDKLAEYKLMRNGIIVVLGLLRGCANAGFKSNELAEALRLLSNRFKV